MIIPFLFNIYDYAEKCTLLDVFYKFTDFCNKNKLPMIVQEKFLKDPKEFAKEGMSATTKYWEDVQGYKVPSVNDIEKVDKFIITNDMEQEIISEYPSIDKAIVSLFKERNLKFEEIIESAIKKFSNCDVKAIITWFYYPSLEFVAKKYGIAVIQYEMAPIRYPNYNERMGYFKFGSKYDNKNINKEYKEFLKNKKIIFDRRELLSLFLNTNDLNQIENLYKAPEYEVAYASGLKDDKFEEANTDINFNQVLEKIQKNYKEKEILVAAHPAYNLKDGDVPFELVHARRPYEWIYKCENVIYNVSNIGFEVALFGRKIISLSKCLPTSFSILSDLSDKSSQDLTLEQLNFLIFYSYTSYDLMFDVEYIKWRLTNPSVKEIYEKNLEYLLKKRKLNIDKLKKLNLKDRLPYILKKFHKLDNDVIEAIDGYSYKGVIASKKREFEDVIAEKNAEIESIREKIELLEKDNNKLLQEINKVKNDYIECKKNIELIINSKSWKITKPFREIVKKIKNRSK